MDTWLTISAFLTIVSIFIGILLIFFLWVFLISYFPILGNCKKITKDLGLTFKWKWNPFWGIFAKSLFGFLPTASGEYDGYHVEIRWSREKRGIHMLPTGPLSFGYICTYFTVIHHGNTPQSKISRRSLQSELTSFFEQAAESGDNQFDQEFIITSKNPPWTKQFLSDTSIREAIRMMYFDILEFRESDSTIIIRKREDVTNEVARDYLSLMIQFARKIESLPPHS